MYSLGENRGKKHAIIIGLTILTCRLNIFVNKV